MSATPSTSATPAVQKGAQRKHLVFLIANGLIFLMIAAALAFNPHAHPGTGVYVIVLFITCSMPAMFITSYRGKASLMLMFMAFYFASFGLKDLSNLISSIPVPPRSTNMFFTEGEIAILIGAIAFLAGYALSSAFASKKDSIFLKQEWSPKLILVVAIVSWIIGFVSNAYLQLGVGDTYYLGDNTLGPWGGFIAHSRAGGPLGVLMLTYSYLTTRNKLALLVLIGMLIGDFVLGFVGDTKETAFRGPLLFLFSYLILRERLPIVTTVIVIVVAGLTFDYFAAYRTELGARQQTRAVALSNFDTKLDAVFGGGKSIGQRFADGIDYFSTRVTLKHNVEMIVSRIGKDKEFKEGHTLQPLLYAFIPRFFMPNKQDSGEVGRTFNREFHISESRDTYISVSLIGELYWNYGYTGIIIGMACIGLLMSYVASLASGDKNNLPRFLLLLFTVYILILRSESGIAMTYTVWARTALMLLFIHMLMPKKLPASITTTLAPTLRRPLTNVKTPFKKPSVK